MGIQIIKMRIPSFALICCCCCTHAYLSATDASRQLVDLDHDALRRLPRSDDHHHHDDDGHDDEDGTVEWDANQAWLYGTLANTCMVSIPIGGTFILRSHARTMQNILVNDFFVSLAVSTMLGDAFFHILPHMLGLHSHDGHAHGIDHLEHDEREDQVGNGTKSEMHNEEEEGENFESMIQIGTIVGSIYTMWFISVLMRITGTGHAHSCNVYEKGNECSGELLSEKKKKSEKEDEEMVKWSSIGGVLVGDCMCNGVDGIAMGVAWQNGYGTGMATMVAILMHEAPNVLGNFVVYQKLGLCANRALYLIVGAAGVCYVGLFTGLALGSNPAVVKWLLGVVAGLFIHIPLVDIIPEMKIKPDCTNKYARFATQNFGFILGFTIMIMIAIYE